MQIKNRRSRIFKLQYFLTLNSLYSIIFFFSIMHFFLFASQLDSQYFDYFRSHDLTGNLQYRAQHFLCLSIGINKLGTLMDEIYWDFFIERRFLVMYLSNTSVISVELHSVFLLAKPKNNERINTSWFQLRINIWSFLSLYNFDQ